MKGIFRVIISSILQLSVRQLYLKSPPEIKICFIPFVDQKMKYVFTFNSILKLIYEIES